MMATSTDAAADATSNAAWPNRQQKFGNNNNKKWAPKCLTDYKI